MEADEIEKCGTSLNNR